MATETTPEAEDAMHIAGVDADFTGVKFAAEARSGGFVNPTMAPEFQILRKAGLPLELGKLPNIKLEGDKVVFSTMTLGTISAPNYMNAFEALIKLGCRVRVVPNYEDPRGFFKDFRAIGCDVAASDVQDFASFSITIPESLFPQDVVKDIGASVAYRAAQEIERTPIYDQANLTNGC